MAAPAAAEGPVAGGEALSGADKEKLREKLELLRREYSETVCRLRRARRAERARSHGRATTAEEGGRREQRPSGSRDFVAPAAGKHGTSELPAETCPGLDTEKKTSVTCENSAGLSSCEVTGQESPQASQKHLCCGVGRPAPEEKKPQTSMSLRRLRRRTRALGSEERESARDGHLTSAGEAVTSQLAQTEKVRSPVFRRSSTSNTEEDARRGPRPVLMQSERSSSTPPAAAFGAVQDPADDGVPPGGRALRDSGSVQQPQSLSAVAPSEQRDPAQPCSGKSDGVLLGTSGGRGEESSSIVTQTAGESLCEGQAESPGLWDLQSGKKAVPADRNSTVTPESQSHRGNPSDTKSSRPCPTDLALGSGKELLENPKLDVQSRLCAPEKARAPESPLGSCTVVEGLLFPVEYYVRTTRRMSSCQRKVDLEAVILSQLGRSRKGQRSKGKQNGERSGQPSQERAGNDLELGVTPLPFLGAENDPANSGSPQKSCSVSSGSSTSLGSVSQNSMAGTWQGQRPSQGKQEGKRRSVRIPPAHPVSQDLTESLDLVVPGESSDLLSPEHRSEKGNSEAHLQTPPLDERRFPAATACESAEAEGAGAAQPASADPPPGRGQVLGRCREIPSEQLQDRDSLNSGAEASTSPAGDPEGSPAAWPADRQPGERVRKQRPRGARGAERQLVPRRRSLRSSASSQGKSRREPGSPAGSEGPAPGSDTCGSLFSFRSLRWLVPRLGISDFHLPDEEFGPLKLEKAESSPVNDLEEFVLRVPGGAVAAGDAPAAQMSPEEAALGSLSPCGSPRLPHVKSPVSRRDLSTHELLLTPTGTVLPAVPAEPESQISSSGFPVVGPTPALLPPVHSELFPSSPPAAPLPASPCPSGGAAAQPVDDGQCPGSALPLHLGSCGAGGAREEEQEGTTLPLGAERGPDSKSGEAAAVEKHQQPESDQQRSCRASQQKKDAAEHLSPAPPDDLTEESLQLVSELKDASSSCAVDVSTVWWEAAGGRELCVVTACESSVTLWKPLGPSCWEKVQTWQLREIPVIQIVPLPDTCNVVCVALGELEVAEIRLLLYSSENDSFQQSLVRTGTIKAVLGLKERRLVSSSRTVQEQQVEIASLSETGGSKDRQTLMAPEETVLAFAEVEGLRDALVGTTAVNSVVLWNVKTGQLLRKMPVGYSYPASVCHQAYADSGLLFVVLSHPHTEESESCGNAAFRVVAFNPTTARSAAVMFSSLPPGHAGRYLEGHVRGTLATAVLTSGAIAVWDLLLGYCTALLPVGSPGSWALARWATAGAWLLAGRRDGTVCLYRYRQPQLGAA